MDKIQNLIDELEKLKNGIQNEKKYNYEFEEITNTQINFQSSGEITEPFKEDVKKLNKIFEGFINLSKGQYNISSKMEKLKEIKTNIENLLNGYLNVLNENKTNFNNSKDENINKKFMNLYKRLNIDLIDEFQSFSTLFNELYDNITNFANGLKKNRKDYEKSGKDMPKGDNISPKKIEEFKNRIYKTFRNVEVLIAFVEDTLTEIENTKEEWRENKNQFNKRIEKINSSFINNFQNINIDRIREINDTIINYMNKFDAFKFQKKQSDFEFNKDNMRLDILLIVDTTYTMSSYLDNLKDDLKSIIESINDKFPLSVVKTGFIGYKDFDDLELGDDYINIDFSINYNQLIKKIKEIQADGGEKDPKDVAGALKLALEKKWGPGKKMAILITNSPCHGKEYNDNDDKIPDGYNNQDFERKKINDYLEEFIEKKIYLIGYKISDKTNMMYKKFREFYDSKNEKDLFSEEMGKLKDIIYNKVKDLLKEQKKEVLNI